MNSVQRIHNVWQPTHQSVNIHVAGNGVHPQAQLVAHLQSMACQERHRQSLAVATVASKGGQLQSQLLCYINT